MNILFVQHGDYADAYRRFAEGGPETYRDQRRSVDYVARLAPAHRVTTAVLANTEYQTELAPNLHALALPRPMLKGDRLRAVFDTAQADLVVLRTPHLGVLKEAARRGLPLLPCFADIFARPRHPWRRLQQKRLARALHHALIPCVTNHSLNASRSVVTGLGYPANKVVPWDWSRIAARDTPKTGLVDPTTPRAFFAGALSEDKGVGDCLAALALVRKAGIMLRFTFAGPGDGAAWMAKAANLGVADAVDFAGLLPHAEVQDAMRAHDMVVVPSRHSYPEGLPNVIYEGLASRTPLVMSDHPAFAGRVIDGTGCLVFKAADPASLATALTRLVTETDLHSKVSIAAQDALEGLYIGLEWEELMQLFIDDPRNTTGWVARNALPDLGIAS